MRAAGHKGYAGCLQAEAVHIHSCNDALDHLQMSDPDCLVHLFLHLPVLTPLEHFLSVDAMRV
jgi:hypothetical protein